MTLRAATMKLLSCFTIFSLLAAAQQAATVETATVVSQNISRKSRVPGELLPYMRTLLHARVSGFVETIEVDRGSAVKKGQTVVRLGAPELAAQIAETESKAQAVESQRATAEAQRVAAQGTYERLKTASETPGVVTANEVQIAQKAVDAIDAQIRALNASAASVRAAVAPLRELQAYLEIKAPFDGIVTERHVHPGALAGPASGPLVTLEQHGMLRLLAAVPEADTAVIPRGAAVSFKVPAHPGQTFSGTVARTGRSLDAKTRTMPVELDVANRNGTLAPGMYADIEWPARRSGASLLVPATAIATTTERSFVIRVSNGTAEWVNVAKGAAAGELVEVTGALSVGDVVVKRATDEIWNGAPLNVK
ncbi:MAG: efflux RND transporter periplasmic adaptor subunit [Acidobacteria bacterium]|nr:efflux RND transporter periplasmic adaptor subunit [Acidobacteriota bacterium]